MVEEGREGRLEVSGERSGGDPAPCPWLLPAGVGQAVGRSGC